MLSFHTSIHKGFGAYIWKFKCLTNMKLMLTEELKNRLIKTCTRSYYYLVTIYWLVSQLDTFGLTRSLWSKANDFKFPNLLTEPVVACRQNNPYSHLAGVYLKFPWRERSFEVEQRGGMHIECTKLPKLLWYITYTGKHCIEPMDVLWDNM